MKKKFFIRRALNYFIIILIPMLLLFSAMVFMAAQNVNQTLTDENQQANRVAETNLQLVLNSVLTENSYITSMTRMALVLSRALNGENLSYSDSIYIHSLNSTLSSIVQSYSYIDEIFIYLDDNTRIVSAGNAIMDLSQDDWDTWLNVYAEMDSQANQSIASMPVAEGRTSEQLVVCQRMLLKKGCVAVLLNCKQLKTMLQTIRKNEEMSIYLLDANGSVLASTDDEDSVRAADMGALWEANAGNIAEFLSVSSDQWLSQNNENYLLSALDYGEPGIFIVSVVSGQARKDGMLNYTFQLLLTLAASLLVVMILAYSKTRRSFRQINTLHRMFGDAEKGLTVQKPDTKSRDEYDEIMNDMLCLFLNTSYLQTQLKEKQYRQENAELMALQLQINPHFLYNTLQTVDIEARRIDPNGRISTMLGYISDILKYALDNPREPVTLKAELTYLKKYMEIQRYRFAEQFIIYYHYKEKVLSAKVFRMMLQPVLENSLLHGIRGLERMGYIDVYMERERDLLHLRVKDNGHGMTEQALWELRERIDSKMSSSIGLTNLNRRLTLRYGDASALHITSEVDKGTEVSFSIPYEEYREEA